MPIDTADLSKKTSKAIMVEAERFDDNLALQFGLLSYESVDESDFILKSKVLIEEMLRYNEVDLDDIFFGEPPSTVKFHIILNKILDNISKL